MAERNSRIVKRLDERIEDYRRESVQVAMSGTVEASARLQAAFEALQTTLFTVDSRLYDFDALIKEQR